MAMPWAREKKLYELLPRDAALVPDVGAMKKEAALPWREGRRDGTKRRAEKVSGLAP